MHIILRITLLSTKKQSLAVTKNWMTLIESSLGNREVFVPRNSEIRQEQPLRFLLAIRTTSS